MSPVLQEKCGVFAINNITRAPFYCTVGIHALQHRGQEGAGLAVRNNGLINARYVSGQVSQSFDELIAASGTSAIAHVRYATSGKSSALQQPILSVNTELGHIALAHNGNLVEVEPLREKLKSLGCVFQSEVDTEVLIHLINISKEGDFISRIVEAVSQVKGAYSLVIMTPDLMIGLRDPMGIRPLALGKLDGSYVLSSESCAFDAIGADFVRDVGAGEMVIVDHDNNIRSIKISDNIKRRSCIFEYVYFSRPDSSVDGLSVYDVRKNIGQQLAREDILKSGSVDMVIGVPDSGIPAAIGYSQESGLPFEYGIVRSHYIGRTFINPTSDLRDVAVKLKHNANKALLNGKKIVLVDDSIVRGTTSKKIVQLMRSAGAKEVHMRISSPTMTHPCFYGVDTPDKEKLIASNYSVEEIAEIIGVDSLRFIGLDGLYKAVGGVRRYCDACFTGNYLM